MNIAIRHVLSVVVLMVCIGCVQQTTHDEVLEKLEKNNNENNDLKSKLAVSMDESSKLKFQISALEKVLDEIRFGADRLISEITNNLNSKEYFSARSKISLLKEKHPASPRISEAEAFLKIINEEETKEIARLKAESENEAAKKLASENEKIRKENVNQTGIWELENYVDEFRNKTGKKFITLKQPAKGINISNGNEFESWLKFFIDSEDSIRMQLYTFTTQQIPSSLQIDAYNIKFSSEDGLSLSLDGVNFGDGILFFKNELINEKRPDITKNQKIRLQKILKQKGKLKILLERHSYWKNRFSTLNKMFVDIMGERPTDKYIFEINTPDDFGYENALRKLSEN